MKLNRKMVGPETDFDTRKGAWYSYEGDNIGQGRDNTITWLEQNPDQAEVIEQLTRRRLTEGSEVTANSMKPLAAAAKLAAGRAATAEAAVEESSSSVAELPAA